MIKAYHQVGTDSMSPQEREFLLSRILAAGQIAPGMSRIQRGEMEKECFGFENQGINIRDRFHNASAEVIEALSLIASEKISRLPEEGSIYTLFNCGDLIAGDFEMIFLSPGDWYAVENGFVFDAEELLMKGASFRPGDLLGQYVSAVNRIPKTSMKSMRRPGTPLFQAHYSAVEKARKAVEEAIEKVKSEHQHTGKRGIFELKEFLASEYPHGEIVWPGPLPTDLAIEVWEEGKRID